MTDADLIAKAEAAKRRVTFVYDELEKQPKREPVHAGKVIAAIPQLDHLVVEGVFPNTWEPPCVQCGSPLGYQARQDAYAAGKTQCDSCRAGNLAMRLRASGISFREMHATLDEMIRPRDDPANRGIDQSELNERDDEFMRYMTFLQRFATLRPGDRMDPPFAFVYGSLGTGKSAGAERAMRDAIRNGCAGRVVRFSDLVRKIYDTYRRSDENRDERTEDVLRLYSSIHLLIVHEVGPDADTDHALGLFFDWVDDRHQAMLPTIFTSNYAPNEESLGARMGSRASDDVRVRGIVDRISGGGRGNVFCLRGTSWRGRI